MTKTSSRQWGVSVRGLFCLLVTLASVSNVIADPRQNQSKQLRAVIEHYADIAHHTYADALEQTRTLQKKIKALVEEPSPVNLTASRNAWKLARVSYQQTEVFRFGNPNVDDWEPQVNAWPLDEGFIDYVDNSAYDYVFGNPGATANLIANESIAIGTRKIDTRTLTPSLLASLNEFGGAEANVATGYHAIEFLLWGQDRNGTAYGAGTRPASDFGKGNECTNRPCDRRSAYLLAVTELLLSDLENMANQWAPDGNYRQQLRAESTHKVLGKILFGMGSLSLGELAGERMKVALKANSPEDEHDCFSDNTHNAHYYSALGIRNIYTGRYQRADGTHINGPSLSELVAAIAPDLDTQLTIALENTQKAFAEMVALAEHPQQPTPFDMMIAEGNDTGKALITQAISALVTQTELIEAVGRELKLGNLNPAAGGQ